jgi:coatomer subunit beta
MATFLTASSWICCRCYRGCSDIPFLILYFLSCFLSADMEVRRKAMNIVLTMTSSRNVEEVVLFLKKQLLKTQEADFDKAWSAMSPLLSLIFGCCFQAPEYRQLLIQSIHVVAIKFSEVAASVVHALMEFLGDSNNPSALDVVAFVRYESYPFWQRFCS